MAQHKRRNYEVSIWTLQDEFITVLKPSNVENKGQISDGKTLIKDDGTLELSFSIPMYYYEGKKRIENPIWYTTRNGMIVQDMRKIKLIFNKDTDVVQVFEFLINDVKESHNGDILTCDINTEGMIFNELGKWGYKVSLSSEEFYARDYDFFTNGKWKDNNNIEHTEQPRGTLQYWLNHFLTPLPVNTSDLDITKWYYKVEMDWSAYSSGRDSDKVYEDEYTGSWNDTGSGYTPKEVIEAKEKERMVDLEESNAYNLTQNLAETFGIFCRYEYLYDSNYHIIGRAVIFYNNYMKEDDGYLDITYPYSTSAITRQRDSKDVTTKMFVRPVADDTSSSGLITILDVAANKSKEDYLLNFDYLRTVSGVTEEQYAEIDRYEYEVSKCNNSLKQLEGPLIALRNRLPELEAAVTLYTNAIQLDKERISASNDLLNNLDKKDKNEDGAISIIKEAPRTAILKQSSNTDNNGAYYIDLTDHGVVLETLYIYRSYNFTKKAPSDELTTGTPEYDEFGNIIRINNLFNNEEASRTVYLVYDYIPKLYYDRVLRTWQSRLGTDEAALKRTKRELTTAQKEIEQTQIQYDKILTQKRKLIANFEKMMGPALRESYWQPDNYIDYGDNYIDAFSFSSNAAEKSGGSSGYTELFWDTKLFDDEQKTTYEYSAAQTTQFYPCIKLGNKLDYIKEHINELGFMFYDYAKVNPTEDDTHNIRNFPVGSLCQYGFIEENNNVEPVLILTGIENMDPDTIDEKLKLHSPKIGVLITTVTSDGINTKIDSSFDVESDMWVTSATPIYPRIKISSLALKTSADMLGLTYNGVELKNYEDYYILIRDDSVVNNDGTIAISDAAYYITIEPKAMLREGSITDAVKFKFNLSNADTAIYLDAIQVLKENAYPKVSYTIDPSVIDEDFLYTLYNKLNCICNINDTDLKLENIQGYISELELDLDKPENDHIEIKNYKTKFEDLFTSIVAQTEAMKKSAYTIGLAAQAFTSTGDISADVLQNSVMKVDLNYAFNNGKLTIDEKNGIWGISNSGVVAFRGGGIFTATEKDNAGNWKWNTGIVPQGINANLISTGQLDTNRINIYAGDRVRFQLNGEGLFAYKSFFEDFDINSLTVGARSKIDTASKRIDDLDAAQYVVMNQNGLFLIGEQGALVLNRDKTDYIELKNTVKRVEVSWEGFKLRNWNNEQVFWADPDTGNLYVTGTIFADDFRIYKNKADLNDPEKLPVLLDEYLNNHFDNHVKVSESLKEIFTEAGSLITQAGSTLDDLMAEEIVNKEFLKGFFDKAKGLRPTIYTGQEIPENFKPGDIWAPGDGEYKGNRYLAMSFSGNTPGSSAFRGWNKTYDGSLAAIAGTNLSIDTITGIVNILATNKINLKAKVGIELSSGDIQITGNNSINFGSKWINIGSTSGINIVNTPITVDTQTNSNGEVIVTENVTASSRVTIDINGILMHSSKIELMAGDANDVTALVLNPKNGIYMGSTQEIRLFSTDLKYDSNGNIDSTSSANVLLNSSKILFGVNSAENATAVEMTKEYVILAAGGKILDSVKNANINSWTDSDSEVSGIKITKDGIGLATGGATKRSLISILPGSITIGVAAKDDSNEGSFIKLSQDEMKIGTLTNIYINANNIGLDTSDGNNFKIGFWLGQKSTPSLKLVGNNLYIAGTIYANEFKVLKDRDDTNPIPFDQYLEDHIKVSNELEKIFDTAGSIITEAGSALDGVTSITEENAGILKNFLNKVKNLKPVFTKAAIPPDSFKPGDIWESTEDGSYYIATSFSNSPDDPKINNSLRGWNKTYDGSLASINGAGMNIDTVTGTIILKAKSYLELSSGDIQITGNHSVNIGGRKVNIGANSGVNIIASSINADTETDSDGDIIGAISRVLINTNGILMHGSHIELMAGNYDSVAALSLNPAKGIYIGTNKEIRLFSSDITYDSNGQVIGTNVLLSPEKIMFGVSNENTSATAIEMTKNYLIMASGNNIDSLRNGIPTNSNSLTGVKITKDGFYAATTDGSGNRSLLSITPNMIQIGNVSNASGNYILMNKDIMMIGSTTSLIIDAYNVGLNSTISSNDPNIKYHIFRLGAETNSIEPKLTFDTDGTLTVRGTIYATGLYIGEGSSQQTIENYISGKAGAKTFRRSTFPLFNFKTGDLFFNTNDNSTYIAIQNSPSTPGSYNTDNYWKPYNKKIIGTNLTVDCESGNIAITAASNINIESGTSLAVKCAGELHFNGVGDIHFDSGSNLRIYADSSITIRGTESIEIRGGNSINMYGSDFYTPDIKINSTGIFLKGQSIELNAADGTTAIILNNSGINMQTAGDVTLRGSTGIIWFGSSDTSTFSVDPTGVIMCRKIICSGEIIGTIPSSGSGSSSTDPFIMQFNESDTQQHSGNGSHTRITAFRCAVQIPAGTYRCELDWKLICSAPNDGTMNNPQISVDWGLSRGSDFTASRIYTDNQGSWSYGDSRRVQEIQNTTENPIIVLNSPVNILYFKTNVTSYSGYGGSRYDKVYTHTVKLFPQ